MTELNFKGKDFVHNHHLSVPFHPLEPQPDKGIGEVALDGSLIIEGDNLKALKSLIPTHAGRVNCVYIDPPYNTGNEKWCYNDKVNSPMIKEWFSENPVDFDDGLRHDKWCAMMWPRLRLLHELLAEDGVIFVSIDDNEQHHLRMLMDDIFGTENFITSFVWNKKNVVQNDAKFASVNHEYVICYRKNEIFKCFNSLPRSEKANRRYKNLDDDPRGPWQSVALQAKSGTLENVYAVTFPNGVSWTPPSGTFPKFTKDRLLSLYDEGRLFFGKGGKNVPRLKKYLSEVQTGMVSNSVLTTDEVGSTQAATEMLNRIMEGGVFSSPKSIGLIQRFLLLAAGLDAIILDSFAGSGTTAQAVLALNKEDGGDRRFILVECEKDYADAITAERVRRVIRGVPDARDESLREGLGGSFTYCALGPPVELDAILTGKALPAYDQLGALLFRTATNRPLDPAALDRDSNYLGEAEGRHIWLIYRDDLDWLKSPEAAFTLSFARRIAGSKPPDARHLVFAPARFVSEELLAEERLPVEFAPLPFALYRIDRAGRE